MPRPPHAALALLLVVLGETGCDQSPVAATPPGSATVAGFQITGDPAASGGATWSFRATASGTAYELDGILLKPAGGGPFPAVIVSHGVGANVNNYSRAIASRMVGWGAVVIATNYTHAGGVPIGLPGTADERGASAANVARGRKLLELLQSLGYVDMSRVAAHGHSGGAFVTTALVGAAPQAFRAASHSAGGVRPDVAPDIALQLPSESQASAIRAPYQIHHGDNDAVVPLIVDQLFATLLTTRSVTHELVIHPGAGHNGIAESSEVLDRVRSWYRTHGVLNR